LTVLLIIIIITIINRHLKTAILHKSVAKVCSGDVKNHQLNKTVFSISVRSVSDKSCHGVEDARHSTMQEQRSRSHGNS